YSSVKGPRSLKASSVCCTLVLCSVGTGNPVSQGLSFGHWASGPAPATAASSPWNVACTPMLPAKPTSAMRTWKPSLGGPSGSNPGGPLTATSKLPASSSASKLKVACARRAVSAQTTTGTLSSSAPSAVLTESVASSSSRSWQS